MSAPSQIELFRKERHARYLYIQKAKKWGPIILKLMNRLLTATTQIQRWLRRIFFMTNDDSEWICEKDTPGVYRIRFRLTNTNIAATHMGISQEDWISSGMTVNPTVAIVDARTINANEVLWVRDFSYKLNQNQIARLMRIQKRVMDIQDMEYVKALEIDDIANKSKPKN